MQVFPVQRFIISNQSYCRKDYTLYTIKTNH